MQETELGGDMTVDVTATLRETSQLGDTYRRVTVGVEPCTG